MAYEVKCRDAVQTGLEADQTSLVLKAVLLPSLLELVLVHLFSALLLNAI